MKEALNRIVKLLVSMYVYLRNDKQLYKTKPQLKKDNIQDILYSCYIILKRTSVYQLSIVIFI